jgi:hypothetical protein
MEGFVMWRFIILAALFILMPTAAMAEPISAAIAVSIAKATFTQILIKIAVQFAINIVIGFVMQALSPKPKPPSFGPGSGLDVKSRDRVQQFTQPITEWRTIYGEGRFSGPLTFVESTDDNDFLHMVITMTGHQSEAIDTLYLNDEAVSLTYDLDGDNIVNTGTYKDVVRVYTDLGTVGSQPFPALASATTSWTATHRQDGRTKIYVRLKYDQDIFPTAIPNISAWIKGKKVVDPRVASARAWSPNPSLCIRDYLTTSGASTGFGATTLEINDTFTTAAANTSDEIVSTQAVGVSVTSVDTTNNSFTMTGSVTRFFTGDRVKASTDGVIPGGIAAGTDYYYVPQQRLGAIRGQLASTYATAVSGTPIALSSAGSGNLLLTKTGEPRYSVNGITRSNQTGADIISDLLTAMGGRAIYASGKWRLHAAAYAAPTLTFDEGDIISSIDVQTKPGRRDRFNAVKGIYISTLNLDQPSDYPPVTNSTYETEDNGERKFRDYDLPFTNRPHMAQRLAKIELERQRQTIIVKVTTNLKGLQVQAGDTINLTNTRFGWSTKAFEVTGWKLTTQGEENSAVIGCEMIMRETVSDVFDWNSGNETAVDPAPNTNLPSAFTVAAPGNLIVTEELYDTRQSAGVKARAIVSWDAATDSFVDEYQVQYKLSSGSTYTVLQNVKADTTTLSIDDIDPGTYDFRVRAVNHIGVRSAFTEKTQELQGLLAPPTAPQNLTISAAGGLAILRWDRSADLDVRLGGKIYFRHSNIQSGAEWTKSVTIGEAVPGGETVTTLPLKAGTYLAKAIDSSDVESSTFASAPTKQASHLTFTTVSTIQEDTTFPGSTTSIAVDSGVIRLAGSGLVDSIADVSAVTDWDLYGGVVASGTYVFSSAFNFGSVSKRRLTTTVSAIIYNADDAIDSRTSLIDTWVDVDGGGAASADARVYFRQTDDDPTGSPTYGAWDLLESSDVDAWGVQFKAILTSTDPVYNIDVSKLRVVAEQST